MSKNPPVKVGDRIGFMSTGYTLVAGIVLKVEQRPSGNWFGDVRTQDGDEVNRLIHSDYVLTTRDMTPHSIEVWTPIWDALAAQSVTGYDQGSTTDNAGK
jgi:hypothetical protein